LVRYFIGCAVFTLCIISAPAQKPAAVHISVQTDKPVRTMAGGIGASWHAIGTELPSRKPEGGSSYSGSGWGGNPDPGDAKAWKSLREYANWLGLDWVRVELDQRTYEPKRREFSWENPDMRALYRILDWAEHKHVDVFLQQFWGNVDWNAYPSLENDPVGRLRSAPRSVSEYAYGLGELVNHLTRVKHYTCIRWLCINNEPGHDEFSWWQDSNLKALPIAPAIKAVREELDSRGIALPISAPDWTDLPKLEVDKIDFDEWLGAYDLHSYNAVFDDMELGEGRYALSVASERLAEWAKFAHDRNKPLFLSEMGTMAFGWGKRDAGPGSYESGLKDASLIVRGINAGVDGFNRWSFVNRGDLDGQWQLVDTWDSDANHLLSEFKPHQNVYNEIGLLSRFTAKHSSVLETRVESESLAGEKRSLVAAALRSLKGNLTVCVVNETGRDVDSTISLDGLAKKTVLYKYAITPADRDRSDVAIRPLGKFTVGPGSTDVVDHIPATSIAVYSNYRLDAHAPGKISED